MHSAWTVTCAAHTRAVLQLTEGYPLQQLLDATSLHIYAVDISSCIPFTTTAWEKALP